MGDRAVASSASSSSGIPAAPPLHGPTLEVESLTCRVCYDLLRAPLRLHCGHHVCTECAQLLLAFAALKSGFTTGITAKETKTDDAKSPAASPSLTLHRTTSITLTTPSSTTSLLGSFLSPASLTASAPASLVCPACGQCTLMPEAGLRVLKPNETLRLAVEQFTRAVVNPRQPKCMNECGADAAVDCHTCEAVFCAKCHSTAAFSRHRTAVIPVSTAQTAAGSFASPSSSSAASSASASSSTAASSAPASASASPSTSTSIVAAAALSSASRAQAATACLRRTRRCALHPGHEIEFFCLGDDSLLCLLCASGDHKEHEYVPLWEYADQCAQEVEGGVARISHQVHKLTAGGAAVQARIKELEDLSTSVERTLCASVAEIIAAVKRREQILLDMARATHRARVEKLSTQAMVLRRAPAVLTDLLRSLRAAATHGDPISMVSVCQDVKQALRHFDVSAELLVPCQGAGLTFEFNASKIVASLHDWGRIATADLPGKPSAPALVMAQSRTMRLQWSPPPAVTVSLYNVQLAPGKVVEGDFKPCYSGQVAECEVAGLEPGEQYSFRVQAVNAQGRGPFSDVVTYSTSRSAPGKGFEFKYVSDFDTNGVLYWLGTARGTKPRWSNPANAGHIVVTRSSDWAGTAEEAAGRASTNCYTANLPMSWWAFDLRSVRVAPSHYTLRHSSSPTYCLRHWQLQASNDGVGWTTLCWHFDDKRLQGTPEAIAANGGGGGATATWPVPHGPTSAAYRCFRIQQTGPNSGADEYPSEGHYLMLSGFEIYGRVEII